MRYLDFESEFESRFPLTKRRRQLSAVFFRFALSAMMTQPSDPNTPLSGVGGVDIVREKPHTRSVGTSLVFRSENQAVAEM